MHGAPRAVSLAMLLGLLLPAAAGTPASAPPRRATIEPTLPLLVDVRLEGVERSRGRARARLVIDVQADGSLDAVDLSLSLPDALRIQDASALPSGFRMAHGERRRFVLPVEGPDDRDLPIRISGAFRMADGRSFRLGQGVTLEAPRDRGRGRSHLGAWEVMAVPLEELRR